MTSLPQRKLPTAPIDDYMEAHSLGLSDLFPLDLAIGIDTADPGMHIGQRVVPAEYRSPCLAWDTRLRKARERGWIWIRQADEFCVQLLGKHPFEIYGNEWFGEVAA